MSVCQSWFGVLRSKNRGLGGLLFGFFFGGSTSPSSFRVLRTVSGLAFRKNIRLSRCEIRLLPYSGCFFFRSTALDLAADFPADFFRLLPAVERGLSPSSPSAR